MDHHTYSAQNSSKRGLFGDKDDLDGQASLDRMILMACTQQDF